MVQFYELLLWFLRNTDHVWREHGLFHHAILVFLPINGDHAFHVILPAGLYRKNFY